MTLTCKFCNRVIMENLGTQLGLGEQVTCLKCALFMFAVQQVQLNTIPHERH